MKKFLILLLFIAVILIPAVSEVFINYDKEVLHGNIIPFVLVSDKNIDNITLSLNRNNKTYGKFRGYSLDRNVYAFPENKKIYMIMMPVASDMQPDNYRIDIRWQSEGYAERNISNITILERNFIKEEIALTKSLSTLRKDESDRRKRETKAIIKLYRKFNTSGQYINDRFEYPLKGKYHITSYFGDRRVFRYDDGDVSKSIHNGIDYAAVKGTAVYAAGSGKVVFSGNRLITGNSIIIEHLPGLYTVYYHLDKAIAAEELFVEKGDKIGEVGSSGISTGNHLHWEIRNQGIAVNPEQYIDIPLIDKERIISHINASFSDIDRGR